jgi:putative two-component system response regulator
VARIPVIFVTALIDGGAEMDGFDAGGADFVSKPVSPLLLKARVRAQLALARQSAADRQPAGEAASHDTGADPSRAEGAPANTARDGLRLALRYRDEAIARHARRAGDYARVLGRAAGMQEQEAEQLGEAVALHDLGMIGVADAILHKPGTLDEAERSLVRRHPAIGAEIIGEHPQGVLALARGVALTHHERWDGSGYPAGLAGEMIPLAGRIAAVADVFDALTRTQSWRPAWPLEQALAYLHAESGRGFDARLVRLFLEHLPEMLAILEKEPAPQEARLAQSPGGAPQ